MGYYGQTPAFQGRRVSSVQASDIADFLWATYRWMAFGLTLTGITAWLVASSPALMAVIFGNQLVFFALMIAQLALVFNFSRKVTSLSTNTAAGMFLAYAVLNGLTLSSIFMAYSQAAIAQAFFVSAAAFGSLSVYGAVTKRDLSAIQQFLFVGLVGIIIATLVNIFFHSAAVDWVISCSGVLVFAGLTAYDNQNLKNMYIATGGAGNLALHGALRLYLDFINMFLFILRLFDNRR